MSSAAPPAPTAKTTEMLTAEHQQLLSGSAIDLDVAIAAGVRSITTTDDVLDHVESEQMRGTVMRMLPGVLFRLDGLGGNRVLQWRPDNPIERDGRPLKYIAESGSGSVISCHPDRRHLLDGNGPVLLVEGTKQRLAADSYADPDVLTCGIQGCWNWSADGLAVPDLDLLAGRKVTIVPDADAATNRTVWEAYSRLGETLRSLGSTVRYVRLPAGGKTGLDDFLASRREDLRSNVLRSLAQGAKSLGRRPAAAPKAKAVTEAPVVDWDAGMVHIPAQQAGMDQIPGQILMGAAARIIRTTISRDDLDPDAIQTITHDLHVAIGSGEDRSEHVVREIADADLASPAKWLTQVGECGEGTRVQVTPRKGEDIANAIRAHEPEAATRSLRGYRTGWRYIPGREGWQYMSSTGALGADGLDEDLTCQVSPPLELVDPTVATPAVIRDAWRAALRLQGLFTRRAAWQALVGQAALGISGAPPRGVVYLVGGHGSGKTTLVNLVARHVTPGEVRQSTEATGNSLGAKGIGLHHCPSWTDDARDRDSDRDAEAQSRGIEGLIRAGYDGPSSRRARMTRDQATGRWVQEAPDRTWPAITIAGEVAPSAAEVGSTVERLLTVRVERGQIVDDAALAVAESDDPRWRLAWADLIRWVARQIDAQPGPTEQRLGVWQQALKDEREQLALALHRRHPELTDRQVRVAAGPMLGWQLYLDAARAAGALTEADRDASLADGIANLEQEMLHHARTVMGGSTSDGRVLDAVRDAVASGRYVLAGDADHINPGQQVLGARIRVTVDGETSDAVALIPSVVSQITGIPVERLGRALRPALVADAGGKATRAAKIPTLGDIGAKARTTRCYVILAQTYDTALDAALDTPKDS